MVLACIRVELPEGRWKTDASRDHPTAVFQLLSTVENGERAVGSVTVSGRDISECLSTIGSHPDIDAFEIVDRSDTSATVQLEMLEPTVVSATSRAKTPLVYPARIGRGELTATIVGTHTAISRLGEQLRAAELNFEVV